MRKIIFILIFCLLFCIASCNFKSSETSNDINVSAKDVLADDHNDQGSGMFNGYYGYDIQINGATEFYQSARFASLYPYNVTLEVIYAPSFDFPSPIGADIIVNEDKVYIGLPVGDIDINPYSYPTINTQLRSDDWYQSIYDDRGYLYYGELNELSPGVYVPKGEWVNDLSKFENFVDEDIDFYLVYKYECIYLFFEKVDVATIYEQVQFGLPHYTKVIEGVY